MKIYHGTDDAGYEEIMRTGVLRGPVYFVGDIERARDYGEHVFCAEVDDDNLLVDLDMPGGKLMTVVDAVDYLGLDCADELTIENLVCAGYAVGVLADVLDFEYVD